MAASITRAVIRCLIAVLHMNLVANGVLAMACAIFTIEMPGRPKLGIMPRPRGGDWLDADILSVSRQGFDLVLSLLEDAEIEELALSEEDALCAKHGLQFVRLPIRDLSVPPLSESMLATLSSLQERWCDGKAIVIHCRMAYGRAPMIAASLMISRGCPLNEALQRLSAARGTQVPETDEQRAWLADFERLVRSAKD